MKNGIYQEGDYLVYYKDDKPTHAGVVKIDDKIYYAGSHGYIATGQKDVHREMCNGILERGTYTFDENGVLIEGSYIKPKSDTKKSNRISHQISKSKRNAKKQLTSVTTAVKDIKSHKKNIKKAACLVVGVVLVLSGAFLIDELTKTVKLSTDGQLVTEQNTDIRLPVFEEEVFLCSEVAKAQQEDEMSLVDAVRFGLPYMPFIYEYTLGEESGTFLLSEHQDFRKSDEFFLFPGSNKLTIDNLKTNTQYYYKVTVEGQEYFGTFKTAETTRFVCVQIPLHKNHVHGKTAPACR